MGTVSITVSFTGPLRTLLGRGHESLEVAEGTTVADVITSIAEGEGDGIRNALLARTGGAHPALLVVVDDRQVPAGTVHRLRDGEHLTLIHPLSGG